MKRNRLLSCYPFSLRVTKMMLSFAIIAMITLISSSVWAQTVPVKGKVTDQATGETLPGVVVKASSGAAIATSELGTFTIQADPKGTLTFSYLGYESKVVQVNGQLTINAGLTASNKLMNEVIVVGYGTQKKKDVAGAVTHVDIEGGPKENVPYVNGLEALQGTSGINIGASTSAGATPSIQIRGQNSINANNSPLIVLDGVIFNGDLNEINVDDIASYDVLKDASSAAIYGSRSANGVVIITTKRGKTDKPEVRLNAYYGTQSWTRNPDMRNGPEYIQFRQDLAASKGSATDIPSVFQQSPLELQAINTGHTMNWLKDVQQYAPNENIDLSVSGKSDKTNYYFSGGFLKQNGVLANDFFSKPNITMKIESKINDWLTVGVNAYYSERDYDGIAASLYMATYLSPYSYKYVAGSTTQLQRYPQGSASNYNPYWGSPSSSFLGPIDDNMERYTSVRGIAFIEAKVPFIPGLQYRMNVTGDRQTSDLANFHHETAEVNTLTPGDLANPNQFLSKAYGNKTQGLTGSYTIDNLLTYNRQFGDHHIDALVGYTRDDITTQNLGTSGSDFSGFGTTVLGFYSLQNALTQKVSSTYTETSNVGYLGRINYNFKSKYYATVNFRRDANSAFAPGHKYGDFPGAEVAWVPTEENFMKNVNWVDNLKLRASYGRTGNQGITAYSTQTLVSGAGLGSGVNAGYTVFNGVSTPYTYPYQLGNQNITWETTTALNFGLDFGILKGRLSGSIDVYSSKTTNELQQVNLPIFTGFPSVQSNLGEVHNKGIELSLNSVNIKTASGFIWSTGYGFWINRNKLVHITGIPNPVTGIESDNIGSSLFIGKSLGAIYDYTPIGIVQTTDAAYIAANSAVPGDVKFKDLNGDGKITAADRSVIGYDNTKPNYSMNMSNTFTYKNFQLYFQVNAVIGGHGYDMATNLRGLDPGAVQIGNWLNLPYWTPTNPENKYPRPNYGNPNSYGFYQNTGYARLQDASFSYLFPKSLTSKLKISSLRLYVSGTNLVTFTGWTGLDPANAGQIGGNGGSTNSSVPLSNPIFRTVSFGLNAGF
ncbi:MAG: TonB-dependent receptor plug [Mucilaginibacter sp.]|jgi:TonB-linked SusC/RagA family outer membrane protein|nr:TonB-dependent receptor plug [Mucilaginibacter sp.]